MDLNFNASKAALTAYTKSVGIFALEKEIVMTAVAPGIVYIERLFENIFKKNKIMQNI